MRSLYRVSLYSGKITEFQVEERKAPGDLVVSCPSYPDTRGLSLCQDEEQGQEWLYRSESYLGDTEDSVEALPGLTRDGNEFWSFDEQEAQLALKMYKFGFSEGRHDAIDTLSCQLERLVFSDVRDDEEE